MASASVALGAAFLAFHNTTRSIRGAREQETHRRKRKQSAVRAVLPIALSELSGYAEQSANQLNNVSPTMGMTDRRIEPIPTKTLERLADFIEYSDTVDVAVVEATTAFVQIFNSRLRALIDADTPTTPTTQWEIAARILDAASIYAGAAAVYTYARRQKEQLPHSVSWGDVRGALSNMGFLEGEHEDLDKMLEGRKKLSAGPFDHLARRSTCPAGLELEAVKSTGERSGRSEAT